MKLLRGKSSERDNVVSESESVRVSEAECMGESWGCSVFGWEFSEAECGLNNIVPGERVSSILYYYLFLSVDRTG